MGQIIECLFFDLLSLENFILSLHVKMPKRYFFVFFFSLTNVLSVVKTVIIVNVHIIFIMLCLLFVKSLNVAIYFMHSLQDLQEQQF